MEEEIGIILVRIFPDGSKWDFQLFRDTMLAGSPLLANLPNYFIENLSLGSTEKFLYHIRNWREDEDNPSNSEDSSSSILWNDHKASVKRIWAHIALAKAEPPSQWSPKILRQLGFLLMGATYDELKELPTNLRMSHDLKMISNFLRYNWDKIQAKAVFDLFYSDMNDLEEKELRMVRELLVKLLPRQIKQFNLNVTDFGFIAKEDAKISLASEKQVKI